MTECVPAFVRAGVVHACVRGCVRARARLNGPVAAMVSYVDRLLHVCITLRHTVTGIPSDLPELTIGT